MDTSPRFENLLAVPSFHYDPVFAAHVRQAFESFRPTVVALELSADLEPELAWALECWPVPVCSMRNEMFMPFVPGDSMFEAYRLARATSAPVRLVDLRLDAPIERSDSPVPGPECADRLGALYLETVTALDALEPVAQGDLDREAFMAAQLAQLMKDHERVLWVGGMSHWARLRAHLASGLPSTSPVAPPRRSSFRRLRLAPMALENATGRLPYLVARYALDPLGYDEPAALRALALDAVESASPADVARMLVYARNLAMSERLGDRPSLVDLLTASSAVIGDLYAGRLFALAMEEPTSEATAALPRLDVRGDAFGLDGCPIRARPYVTLGRTKSRRVTLGEVRRRSVDEPYRELPAAGPTETLVWKCFPPDEDAWETFVRYVLRRATIADPSEVRSAPFRSGMRDGVDVRATVRGWRDGNVFVRETNPTRLHVTNGLIDFANDTEQSPMLRGTEGGWADPSARHVGSASRHHRSDRLQREPCVVNRMYRELSLITLDAPTLHRTDEAKSFYSKVILPLVRKRGSDLYAWLEVMFAFCAGKPFAWFSHYVPSARAHRLAAGYGVRIVHYPLRRIPRTLLERNRSFRFMNLTFEQWDEVKRRVAEGRGCGISTTSPR